MEALRTLLAIEPKEKLPNPLLSQGMFLKMTAPSRRV
jgi:hypothetical protein